MPQNDAYLSLFSFAIQAGSSSRPQRDSTSLVVGMPQALWCILWCLVASCIPCKETVFP
jgi:hypothetical protein